ncbi:hypothetical protein HY213_04650 [Candidatus Peregrinibacteria bacterium]|nr:hypothetical protein [Candidatus Peregrinibacteria bacterium]
MQTVDTVTAAVENLKTEKTMANAEALLDAARLAWGELFAETELPVAQQNVLLDLYVRAMETGRRLLSTMQTTTLDELSRLPEIVKICRIHWDWASVLLTTDNRELVTSMMDDERKAAHENVQR